MGEHERKGDRARKACLLYRRHISRPQGVPRLVVNRGQVQAKISVQKEGWRHRITSLGYFSEQPIVLFRPP